MTDIIVDANQSSINLPFYKHYTAILDQSGADAPVATVSVNTLGVALEWTREFAGTYTLLDNSSESGVFTDNKTFVFATSKFPDLLVGSAQINSTQVSFYSCGLDGVRADDCIIRTSIEIRVYP